MIYHAPLFWRSCTESYPSMSLCFKLVPWRDGDAGYTIWRKDSLVLTLPPLPASTRFAPFSVYAEGVCNLLQEMKVSGYKTVWLVSPTGTLLLLTMHWTLENRCMVTSMDLLWLLKNNQYPKRFKEDNVEVLQLSSHIDLCIRISNWPWYSSIRHRIDAIGSLYITNLRRLAINGLLER